METKYKKLLGIGTGVLLIGSIAYFLYAKSNKENRETTKSIDSVVEREQPDSQILFGDFPYVPERA